MFEIQNNISQLTKLKSLMPVCSQFITSMWTVYGFFFYETEPVLSAKHTYFTYTVKQLMVTVINLWTRYFWSACVHSSCLSFTIPFIPFTHDVQSMSDFICTWWKDLKHPPTRTARLQIIILMDRSSKCGIFRVKLRLRPASRGASGHCWKKIKSKD